MTVQVIALASSEIAARQTQIVGVYRRAFTPPPYSKPDAEIAEFASSFLGQFDREGYRLVAALDGDSWQLVGFAYGYSSAAGRWWHEQAGRALPALAGSPWLDDSFQLVEIALDPQYQGQGIGGRLHDQLLAEVRHDRAILATLQADTAAFRLYRSRNWQIFGADVFFPGIPRRYQILGLELRHGM